MPANSRWDLIRRLRVVADSLDFKNTCTPVWSRPTFPVFFFTMNIHFAVTE